MNKILNFLQQIGCTLALADGESFGRWNFIKEIKLELSPFSFADQTWFYICDGKKLVVRNALPNIRKVYFLLSLLEIRNLKKWH